MESYDQYLDGMTFLDSKPEAVCGESDLYKPISAIFSD